MSKNSKNALKAYVSKEEKQKFSKKAEDRGRSESNLLKRLINLFLKGDIDI